MPPNLYDNGLFTNLWEVLYPLSSRPTRGFAEGRAVGGALLRIASPPVDASSGQRCAGVEAAGEQTESSDDDSDDGATLPAAKAATTSHPHED